MTQDQAQFNSKLDENCAFKFLELTPEMLEAIETGESLTLKCPTASSDMVVCTTNATFKLRQMNQTNTLMLVRPKQDESGDGVMLEGFGSVPNYLEPQKFAGSVDFSNIPVYQGDDYTMLTDGLVCESLDKLKARSLISDQQFEDYWYRHAGVEKNGIACLLDDELLKVSLDQVLLTVLAEKMGFTGLDIATVIDKVGSDQDPDVIHCTVRRFSKQRHSPYDLDLQEIVKWEGLKALQRYASNRELDFDEFKQKWRESIPIENENGWDLNLVDLTGHFVMPTNTTIRNLERKHLSNNAKIRFQQLLSVKPRWELDEMVPFIDDLRNKTTKLESFVMKYARKKTVGKKIYITARA